jgi:hypothetical protein
MTTKFFSPLSFVAVFGSGIRDPGWVKIRIRDKHPGSATLLVPIESFYSLRIAHLYLMKKSAKVLHYFRLDCGMLEFFKYSTHEF